MWIRALGCGGSKSVLYPGTENQGGLLLAPLAPARSLARSLLASHDFVVACLLRPYRIGGPTRQPLQPPARARRGSRGAAGEAADAAAGRRRGRLGADRSPAGLDRRGARLCGPRLPDDALSAPVRPHHAHRVGCRAPRGAPPAGARERCGPATRLRRDGDAAGLLGLRHGTAARGVRHGLLGGAAHRGRARRLHRQ